MSFSDYPWCSRALNLFAPHPDEVDRFCRFIEEQLVPDGIDTLMLIDAFSADWFHMGGDEVFCIGMCERCRETASGELFARW